MVPIDFDKYDFFLVKNHLSTLGDLEFLMGKYIVETPFLIIQYELYSPIFGPVQSMEYRVQTESDAYEPTVQLAQVG